MVSRSLKGRAPSDGDRNHFHHHLQDRIGKTAGLCTYLGVVGASSLVASWAPHLSLACMVVLAAFYFSFAWLTEVDVKVEDEEVGGETPEDRARPRLVKSASVVPFDGKDATAARE